MLTTGTGQQTDWLPSLFSGDSTVRESSAVQSWPQPQLHYYCISRAGEGVPSTLRDARWTGSSTLERNVQEGAHTPLP